MHSAHLWSAVCHPTHPPTACSFDISGHGHDHGDGPKRDDDAAPVISAEHRGHAHTLIPASRKKHADLGILGVLIHLIGDAINNVAVMISAGVLMATGFVYADPIASAFVGMMIVGTSFPLVIRCGRILLDSAPMEINLEGVGQDIRKVAGIEGLHEMHIWSLSEWPCLRNAQERCLTLTSVAQSKALATVHVATSNDSMAAFMTSAQRIHKVRLHAPYPRSLIDPRQCLHEWGIHNTTIQPELILSSATDRAPMAISDAYGSSATAGVSATSACRLRCLDNLCDSEVCCD
jgi:solute carrier family 30 (zinc transporter), member 1